MLSAANAEGPHKIVRLRHPIIRWRNGHVPALGCRWCGYEERGHGRRWTRAKRWHVFEYPTVKQIAARNRAFRRFLERTGYEA